MTICCLMLPRFMRKKYCVYATFGGMKSLQFVSLFNKSIYYLR
ncbi:MAG: hypothetical protein ACTS6G_05855 [Candidatus Hodgkinia cicadicola]